MCIICLYANFIYLCALIKDFMCIRFREIVTCKSDLTLHGMLLRELGGCKLYRRFPRRGRDETFAEYTFILSRIVRRTLVKASGGRESIEGERASTLRRLRNSRKEILAEFLFIDREWCDWGMSSVKGGKQVWHIGVVPSTIN